MSLATRLLLANPGAQVTTALSGALTTPSAKGAFGGDYDSIATSTGITDATRTFSSIPQTYKTLQLMITYLHNAASSYDDLYIRINGDSGSNYTFHQIAGNGTDPRSQYNTATSIQPAPNNTNGGSVFTVAVVDFVDYSRTGKFRPVQSVAGFDKNGSGDVQARHMMWMNSADPITSLTITYATGATFDARSEFALYGIKG